MAKATARHGARRTHLKVGGTGDIPGERELRLIAERLRALRLTRGLTQWALGERGLSYKYYQRIEAGRANVTIRTLARVAEALGTPFHEVFRPRGEPTGDRRRRQPRLR